MKQTLVVILIFWLNKGNCLKNPSQLLAVALLFNMFKYQPAPVLRMASTVKVTQKFAM